MNFVLTIIKVLRFIHGKGCIMSFTSTIFIFIFLPLLLITAYCIPSKLKNLYLLIISLLFYYLAEPRFVSILVISVVINYFIGLFIGGTRKVSIKKYMLFLGVFYNLGVLAFYKYVNFFIENINTFFSSLKFTFSLDFIKLVLPIGISFYTFQCISYLIDVYRKDEKLEKNIINLGLYVTFFPQLFAGPIMKYKDMSKQIRQRIYSSEVFVQGIERFILGLFKKLVIAETLAITADKVFKLNSNELSTSIAWLGIVSYTFQIYYDFSSYSDMAIGLGRMLGFNINENFNYPYIATSIKDFWNRWHISLSTWFKEYLYIPLGGNRGGKLKTYRNLFIVFFLCGLWHGAKWNFILWGIYYGVILIIERTHLFNKLYSRMISPIKHIYTLIIVIIGWVMFRADSFYQISFYIKAMFGLNKVSSTISIYNYINKEVFIIIVLATVLSAPIFNYLRIIRYNKLIGLAKPIFLIIVLFVSILYLSPSFEGTESIKFIYTQF